MRKSETAAGEPSRHPCRLHLPWFRSSGRNTKMPTRLPRRTDDSRRYLPTSVYKTWILAFPERGCTPLGTALTPHLVAVACENDVGSIFYASWSDDELRNGILAWERGHGGRRSRERAPKTRNTSTAPSGLESAIGIPQLARPLTGSSLKVVRALERGEHPTLTMSGVGEWYRYGAPSWERAFYQRRLGCLSVFFGKSARIEPTFKDSQASSIAMLSCVIASTRNEVGVLSSTIEDNLCSSLGRLFQDWRCLPGQRTEQDAPVRGDGQEVRSTKVAVGRRALRVLSGSRRSIGGLLSGFN